MYTSSRIEKEDIGVIVNYITDVYKQYGKVKGLQIALSAEYDILNNEGIKISKDDGTIVGFSVYNSNFDSAGNGCLLYFFINEEYRVGLVTPMLCKSTGEALKNCDVVLTRPITKSQYMPPKYFDTARNTIDMKGLLEVSTRILRKGE